MEKNQSDSLFDNNFEENRKNLSSGVVLLARDVLKDPNFDSSLVLVCIHSTEGSYGLVLNRPCHMPLSEIFDGFKGIDLKREIYIGGPVQLGELQVLQITDSPVENAFQVAPDVFLGGKWEGIGHMIETDPKKALLFLGYSGWGEGQLEEEVLAGAWDVFSVNIKKLLMESKKEFFSDYQTTASFLETLKI
jgi:putative transcriptional regulator